MMGEHIRALKRGRWNHAIDCGDETVDPLADDASPVARVRRSYRPEFVAGAEVVEVVTHRERTFPADEVVARAYSRIADPALAAMFRDSESFAEWCTTGRPEAAPGAFAAGAAATPPVARPAAAASGGAAPRARAKPARPAKAKAKREAEGPAHGAKGGGQGAPAPEARGEEGGPRTGEARQVAARARDVGEAPLRGDAQRPGDASCATWAHIDAASRNCSITAMPIAQARNTASASIHGLKPSSPFASKRGARCSAGFLRSIRRK